ncbi:RNA pseudouridine synthase [Rhodobacteraceae bacterium RKSG542]|nr:RNA pseudouridine synthase [Pseudovibrio flavus]
MSPYLDVIHQDEQILVMAKQSGLLTVPGKAAEHSDCLEARARETYPTATTVHRLDMDTSGVIVMAMNREAHRHLGLQFERRKTRKTYIARVYGHIEEDQGRVDLPLRCDWPNRPKQMVCFEHGRAAQTDWEVIAREEKTTLVRLHPITGRSHQLRVHLLSLGHPIVGDRFYADGDALAYSDRLQLHAETLEFHHPVGGDWMSFSRAAEFS